jgi:hypothetical protein
MAEESRIGMSDHGPATATAPPQELIGREHKLLYKRCAAGRQRRGVGRALRGHSSQTWNVARKTLHAGLGCDA